MRVQVIKFVDEGSPREITAVDVGVLELKSAITSLESSIDRMQAQIDE